MDCTQFSGVVKSKKQLRERFVEASLDFGIVSADCYAYGKVIGFQSKSHLLVHPEVQILSSTENAELIFNLGLLYLGLQNGFEKPNSRRARPRNIQAGTRYFHRACVLGKKEAFRYLGDVYYNGEGVNTCYRTAIHLFKLGAARNDAASKFKLGWCYAFGHGTDVEPQKCVRLLQESVEGECGEAMFQLGALKLYGKMVPYNLKEAFRLLKRAEKRKVFQAKETLAKCYEFGVGVERDPVQAFRLHRESFDGGNYFSTVPLAECYDKGMGVKQDAEMASKIYEKCMSSGTWYGDFYKAYYGLRLMRGEGVVKNVLLGKAVIIDSMKSGSALSWQALAECYRYGLGVPQDFCQAKKFYLQAVSLSNGVQGITRSYLALGEMFEYGHGVLPNLSRACSYYLSAAERLNQSAQWKVANAFETGIGQKKDLHRAVYFFKLCANSGHVGAERKSAMYYAKGHGLERPRQYLKTIDEGGEQIGRKEHRN